MSGNEPRREKGLPEFSLPLGGLYKSDIGKRFASLVRVPIDYVLELYDMHGRLSVAITLPNTPEEIDCTRPLAGMIRHTLGNMPIRQIVESRNRDISLKGRSGLLPRQGYVRSGDLKFQDPRDNLLEFDGFLQDYAKLQETYQYQKGYDVENETNLKQPKLIFRAFNEKINLLVEPQGWMWRRSADTSRLSYEWMLSLTAYAYADEDGIPQNVFSPIEEYGKMVGDAINVLATSIGVLSNSLTNLRGDVKAIIDPSLNALRNIGLSAQGLANATDQLARLPKDLLAKFVVAAATFSDSAQRFKEITNPFSSETYRTELDTLQAIFGEKANEAEALASQGLFVAGGGPNDVEQSRQALTATDVLPTKQTTPQTETPVFSVYVVRLGDTLFNIAFRVLGNANRWTEIARINGFTDAHNHASGTLEPGTRILLPVSLNTTEQSVLGAKSTDELLGKDIAVNLSTGELEIHGGDIAVRKGPHNLEQALAIRLLTQKQTLPMFPDYGLPIAPGLGMTSRTAAYAGLHCKEQTLRDPRVSKIHELIVEDDGDKLAVSMTVVAINGGDMQFVAPLSTEG